MQPMQMRANADLEDGVALEQGHIVEGFGLLVDLLLDAAEALADESTVLAANALVQLSLGTEVAPELQIDETEPAESTAGTAAVPCQTAEMSPSSSASAEEVEQMLIYGVEDDSAVQIDQSGDNDSDAHLCEPEHAG
ncbi:hypothetical protein DENSPDRAFT_886687 [Dentipellis sp. KUC8613]|nr:hypothetical protein DENSPDRAFT_886687 [Dentipellis sp. KUC8613]